MTRSDAPTDPPPFAMLVLEARVTRLWEGGTGEVVGQPTLGAAPEPGALVWVVRRHERALRARVLESGTLAGGRVRLVVEGWGRELLAPGHGIATDPGLLAPWPAPPPELAADRYLDYTGPPLLYEVGGFSDVDGDVTIRLGRTPTEEERATLERALREWSNDGIVHGFGLGHLHGFYDDEQFGRRWDGPTLRWMMDFGSADLEEAADELARRLAGWSITRGVPIADLRFGDNEDGGEGR